MTKSFADTIVLVDGTLYTGTIIRITDESIILRAGKESLTFWRNFVKEIVFAQSDLVVLTSGDTLHGKVLHKVENAFVVALEEGLKTVERNRIAYVVYFGGPSLQLGELSHTDDEFRTPDLISQIKRSPFFASIHLGTHGGSYFYAGNSYFRLPSFEKSLSGLLYGFEVGAEINRAVAVAFGSSWYGAHTDITQGSAGTSHPSTIGYSSIHAAGIYTFFSQDPGKFELFLRMQLAFQSATSSFDNGNVKASLVPGLGLQYNLWSSLQIFCEIGLRSANLPLNYNGDSINTEGVFIIAGLRLYLVVLV